MNQKKDSLGLPLVAKPDYEAPKIEEIMTSAELEREVHYAGEFTAVE